MASLRWYVALSGAFLMLALAGCGEGRAPDKTVVRIGGASIKTSKFDRWLQVMADESQRTRVAGSAIVPQPPEFTACIAEEKKVAQAVDKQRLPPKGQPKSTDATYKAQCQQEYGTLRDQTMQFLISSAWIEAEARDRGIKLSDADIKRDFDKVRQQKFPEEKDYKAFLNDSGYVDEKDMLYRAKIDALDRRLRSQVLKGADKITDAQIKNYYNKHKARFDMPETRDLEMITTKTKAQAEKARAALDSGRAFHDVALEYNVMMDASKQQVYELPGVKSASAAPAIRNASKNTIEGPIKQAFGFYTVFQVTKITPPRLLSLSQSKETIRQQLLSRLQPKIDAWEKSFRKKWKARTVCQKGFQTSDCSNAPKKAVTTKPATSTPQPTTPRK